MQQQLDDRDHHGHSFHFHKKCIFSSSQHVDINMKRKEVTQGRRQQKFKIGTN